MTGGIGNPDWQRRYTTSAAPIFYLFFADTGVHVSNVSDSNGYEYMLVSTDTSSSTAYLRVVVFWYQDSAGTQQMGSTTWVVPPGSFVNQKIPVITRYYTVEIGNVGGGSNVNIPCVIYGTNADQENMMTQNTDVPIVWGTPNVAAGATVTVAPTGIFGGRVSVFVGQQTNNKWTAWLEYYDWTTQTWNKFWVMHGTDRGMSFRDDVILPYAPIRFNARNDDSVTEGITYSVIAP